MASLDFVLVLLVLSCQLSLIAALVTVDEKSSGGESPTDWNVDRSEINLRLTNVGTFQGPNDFRNRMVATFSIAGDAQLSPRPIACDAVGTRSGERIALLRSGCGDGMLLPMDRGFMTLGEVSTSPEFHFHSLENDPAAHLECVIVLCAANCNGDSCDMSKRRRRSGDEFGPYTVTSASVLIHRNFMDKTITTGGPTLDKTNNEFDQLENDMQSRSNQTTASVDMDTRSYIPIAILTVLVVGITVSTACVCIRRKLTLSYDMKPPPVKLECTKHCINVNCNGFCNKPCEKHKCTYKCKVPCDLRLGDAGSYPVNVWKVSEQLDKPWHCHASCKKFCRAKLNSPLVKQCATMNCISNINGSINASLTTSRNSIDSSVNGKEFNSSSEDLSVPPFPQSEANPTNVSNFTRMAVIRKAVSEDRLGCTTRFIAGVPEKRALLGNRLSCSSDSQETRIHGYGSRTSNSHMSRPAYSDMFCNPSTKTSSISEISSSRMNGKPESSDEDLSKCIRTGSVCSDNFQRQAPVPRCRPSKLWVQVMPPQKRPVDHPNVYKNVACSDSSDSSESTV